LIGLQSKPLILLKDYLSKPGKSRVEEGLGLELRVWFDCLGLVVDFLERVAVLGEIGGPELFLLAFSARDDNWADGSLAARRLFAV
jgi:hypothetical protein